MYFHKKNICIKFGCKQLCTRKVIASHKPTYLKPNLTATMRC